MMYFEDCTKLIVWWKSARHCFTHVWSLVWSLISFLTQAKVFTASSFMVLVNFCCLEYIKLSNFIRK